MEMIKVVPNKLTDRNTIFNMPALVVDYAKKLIMVWIVIFACGQIF